MIVQMYPVFGNLYIERQAALREIVELGTAMGTTNTCTENISIRDCTGDEVEL